MSRGYGSFTQAMTLAGIKPGERTEKEDTMPIPRLVLCVLLCAPFIMQAHADDLGNLNANPFGLDSMESSS